MHGIGQKDGHDVRSRSEGGSGQQRIEGLAQRAGAGGDRRPQFELADAAGSGFRRPRTVLAGMLIQQRESALAQARRPGRVCRPQQVFPAAVAVGAQTRGSLESAGCDRIGGACHGMLARVGEQSGDGGVGMPDRLGEVPRSAIRVRRRDGIGRGSVRRVPVLRRCTGVDRRAQQRMPEFDESAAHCDQAQILGVAQATDVDPERRGRVRDEAEIRAAHGGDQECHPALVIQLIQPATERFDDRSRHPQRQTRLRALDDVPVGASQLDQCQRIARRRAVQSAEVLLGKTGSVRLRDQRPRLVQVEACYAHRGEPRHQAVTVGASDAEKRHDRIGRQPACGEQDGVGGRSVREMEVVHDHGDRAVFRISADQAQQGGADGEAVATGPHGPGAVGRQRECTRQRIRVDRRDLTEQAERRAHELQQRRERQFALGLRTGGPQQLRIGERGDGGVEQCGLARTRFACDDQDAAHSQAGRGRQAVDRLLLGLPTHQHAPSLRTRGVP